MEIEISRLRPKIVKQDKEKLYEDVMKQKIENNIYKEENTKLKTKIHMYEGEV